MADTKTSDEAVATTLSGLELLRVVQVGADKQTTINDIIADKGLSTLDGVETLTNKTLTAPDLGTPSAITLTNATDAPNKRLMTDAERAKLAGIQASAEANTASNKNTAGVGVFKQKTGVDLEFRGINSVAGSGISVTLDAANNEIDLGIDANNFSVGSRWRPATATLKFLFSTSTTDADPGFNTFRTNSATPASITKLWIDVADGANLTMGYDFPRCLAGDILLVMDAGQTLTHFTMVLTIAPTDKTGYWEFTGTTTGASLPGNGVTCTLVYISGAVKPSIQAVVTLDDLSGTIATAQIEDGAVGNAKLATMGANTVKINATGATAAPVNGGIGGGLRMDGVSKLVSSNTIAFPLLFDTQTTTTDPGSTKCNFNAGGTVLVISNTALDGKDLDDYFGLNAIRGKIKWKGNNFASSAWGEFRVDSAASGVGNTYWSFGGAILATGGALPADGEEIILWYESISTPADVDVINKSFKYLRRDAQNQIIDENDVVISGTASVANYAALQALDEAAYENFAVVVDNMAGKPVFLSDGTNFLPLNGSYTLSKQNTSVKKVVCANQVTWTPTNNGGTVQLAGTAHGLTSASVGYSLYLTNTPANWVAGSFHEITAITDANTIQVSTAWVASMGTPTFAAVTTKIPVLAVTVPPLRANSRFLFDCALLASIGPITNKIQCLLGSVELTYVTFNASSNASLPIKAGFKNLNSVSDQSGIYGKSSSGSGGGSANIVMDGVGGNPAGVDTSTGSQVYTVSLECQTVDNGMELGGYIVHIEG